MNTQQPKIIVVSGREDIYEKHLAAPEAKILSAYGSGEPLDFIKS
ncbi:hypothetical protein GCM10010969_34450 [Saccharibacillus kuerlensis]|uniref:Uncharacterized protein n=1 Tax=Saccharibacillus kuerlensis TaxID=459527 RepID=A0ABQ2L8E7_9BACL|nr:hypothetical protein GCM10010969_34450 [Saccharibacillus kuerlensis]